MAFISQGNRYLGVQKFNYFIIHVPDRLYSSVITPDNLSRQILCKVKR